LRRLNKRAEGEPKYKNMPQKINFIFKTDKEKIIEKLNYYGIKKLNFLLSNSGKEKIRGYSGILSKEELIELNENIGIELIGLYLFHHYENDDSLRLSFDAIYALKDQITENIIELPEELEAEFLKGHDILLTEQDKKKLKTQENQEALGFKIIKSKKDNEFIGTGKFTGDRIANYMPKERRLR